MWTNSQQDKYGGNTRFVYFSNTRVKCENKLLFSKQDNQQNTASNTNVHQEISNQF